MSTQRERFQALFGAITDGFAACTLAETTPALLASLVAVDNSALTDTPDENGNVKLTGLPDGNYWKDAIRVQVAEVTNSLSGDQRGKAAANLVQANGVWYGGMIGVCYQAVQVDDGQGGKQWKVPSHPELIPNTRSLPQAVMYDGSDLGTVAGAIAWYTKLAPPGQGSSAGFVPGH